MALTQAGRGKVLAAIAAVLFVGGAGCTELSERRADAAGDDLHADLVAAYGGTTIDDVPVLAVGDLTFFERSGHAPTVATQERARYRVEWFAESRCVLVRWRDGGVDISEPARCP